MTPELITEGNKLIAEFMGWKIQDRVFGYCKNPITLDWEKPDFKYHSSWGWLMPVVEKIEIGLLEEFRVVILEDECTIHAKTVNMELQIEFECITEAYETSKKEAVFIAVVEFIKWYNQNKQT